MDDPLSFSGLLKGDWQSQTFEPFREGIEICVLHEDDPKLALLRYQPGASVPRHRHAGLEIIQVLEGTQSDERGTFHVGDLVLNPTGTEHSVWSDTGCVVLILWERPVMFL